MLDRLNALWRLARRWLQAVGGAAPWLRTAGALVLRPLQAVLTFLLALILVFEEWGWQPLVRAFGWIALWRPIAMLEAALARLPPYGALAAFVVPAALLFPFKLLALWLLAHHMPVSAAGVFVAAKIVGTGLVGRIYLITKPQLMRIGWFARAYAAFMPWKEAVLAHVRASWLWRWGRAVKGLAKRRLERVWQRWAA